MTQTTVTEHSIVTEQTIEPNAIAVRAYLLFEARGCVDGCDVQDWHEAERQLRSEAASDSAETAGK